MAFDFFAEDEDGNFFTNPICVAFSTTSTSGGAWSVDITDAALSNIHAVSAQAISSSNSATNCITASVSTFSTTTVAGGVSKPQTVPALGGSPVQSAGSGITVYVIVIGDQA